MNYRNTQNIVVFLYSILHKGIILFYALNYFRLIAAQKVLTEKKDPLTWAKTQEKIGEIYYRLGKYKEDKAMLEEALEYFHEALYIFENSQEIETCKKINISIAKTSESLAII